jgi:hypothetical protein
MVDTTTEEKMSTVKKGGKMKIEKKLVVAACLIVMMLVTVAPGYAKPGPDQDMSDFPPWIWPIIRTVSVLSQAISNVEMEFDKAAAQIKEAVLHQCDCLSAGEYQFKQMLNVVNAQFDAQLATLKTAKAKATGLGMRGMMMLDDDDWCGTPPKPRPWPPFLMELVKLQAELFRTELIANHKLSKEEIALFDTAMSDQMEAFHTVLR